MPTEKRPYPECQNDGFPMVRIGGRLQCVAEYLDRCIGQARVVGMVQRADVTYYVFEDGHRLPLLCSCCGEPLIISDLDKSCQRIRGRHLEGMAIVPVELEDGSELKEFVLEFSKKGTFSKQYYVPLSPEIAAGLQHPDDCPRKPRTKSPAKRRKKKR